MEIEKALSSVPVKSRPLVAQAVKECLAACNTQDFSVVMQDVYACAQRMAETRDKATITTTMKHLKIILKYLPNNQYPQASYGSIKNYQKVIINRLFPAIDVIAENSSQTNESREDDDAASVDDAPVPVAPTQAQHVPAPQPAPITTPQQAPPAPMPQTAAAPLSNDHRYAQLLDSYVKLSDTVQNQQADHDADIDQLKKNISAIASTQQRILDEVTALKNNNTHVSPPLNSSNKHPLLHHQLIKASAAINEALNSLLQTL